MWYFYLISLRSLQIIDEKSKEMLNQQHAFFLTDWILAKLETMRCMVLLY